jgi:hypothetical protein
VEHSRQRSRVLGRCTSASAEDFCTGSVIANWHRPATDGEVSRLVVLRRSKPARARLTQAYFRASHTQAQSHRSSSNGNIWAYRGLTRSRPREATTTSLGLGVVTSKTRKQIAPHRQHLVNLVAPRQRTQKHLDLVEKLTIRRRQLL